MDHAVGSPNWNSVFGLLEHLTQQKDSLTCLELQMSGFAEMTTIETNVRQFDFSHLDKLESLLLKLYTGEQPVLSRFQPHHFPRSLRKLSVAEFPWSSRAISITALAGQFLTKGPTPESVGACPDDQREPDGKGGYQTRSHFLPNLEEFVLSYWPESTANAIPENDREHFQKLGQRFKTDFDWRFTVNRITKMRNAFPPYLWDEHVPSFVKVYDNKNETISWDAKSDFEIEQEAKEAREREKRRQREEQEEENRRSTMPLRSLLQPSHDPRHDHEQPPAELEGIMERERERDVSPPSPPLFDDDDDARSWSSAAASSPAFPPLPETQERSLDLSPSTPATFTPEETNTPPSTKSSTINTDGFPLSFVLYNHPDHPLY
jgi:hypothetical protein